jgi:ribosome maturation factor RimP
MESDDRIVTETGLEARIAHIVGPVIAGLGYRLVRVKLSGANGATLQIMAERPDGTMTIEDCERLSQDLSPVLDVEDPIDGAYHLEVSSPGIDRPLVRRVDFEKATGHLVKVETTRSIDGRKRFKGAVAAVDDDTLRLKVGGEGGGPPVEIPVPLADIAEAKLTLTDDLVREALRKEKAQPRENNSTRGAARAPGDNGARRAPRGE